MMSRILPIFAVLIAFGLFFGYINPTYSGEIAKISAQIREYDSALAAADQFAAKENELSQQQASINQDGLKRLETFLPDGVDNVQLILDLDALAARSGVQLSNFDIEQSASTASAPAMTEPGTLSLETSNPTESLRLSVSATGTYQSFRTFLSAVEQSLRILDVDEITVTDSTTGVYTYTATFRIYWLR